MKKRIAALLALALLLSLCACGANNSNNTTDGGNNTSVNSGSDDAAYSSEPRIIKVGESMSSINNLDVWITTYPNIYELSDLIFDRLLEKDPETLEVYPSLLTKMPEVSEDGLV